MENIKALKQVLQHLKTIFVGKDNIIDLLGVALVARENIFLLGPPGTAKSAIIRELSKGIKGGQNFEYLLTRFTEPNEIFGPFDIRKLKEGDLVTNTAGMMPEASMVFLDEIFNANSAILNSLLMALNERIFRRGKEFRRLPALLFAGASNILPEDEALNALLDRFLLRVRCDYVSPDQLDAVLIAGRKLEKTNQEEAPQIEADVVRALQQTCKNIDLSSIRSQYISVIHAIRSAGVKVSDRRAVKVQNLISASALLCERSSATLSDLWVMKYIWDTEEQIEILDGIINKVIADDQSTNQHPQASFNRLPDPEAVLVEVQLLQEQWSKGALSFEEQNVIKDKLRYIQGRCDWIQNPLQKEPIQKAIEELWEQILQTV